ncbi:hypothetical protein HN587_07100 [Candidatus Woesearchaeota archaeon]|jgi:predicted DNA binding protein|nr:hypothetical protein [Candidatus Woesearchaeota archaeon]
MKQIKVGVYHHDCWGSFSTENFPHISMVELGAIGIQNKSDKGTLVNSFFKIAADTQTEMIDYLEYLKTIPSINKCKIFKQFGNKSYVFIQFQSPTSSYDSVLKNDCFPIGPIVQEKALEIHTLASEKPKDSIKLLSELSSIGEVKVMSVKDFDEPSVEYSLTQKQLTALTSAFDGGYYKWPRTVKLQDIAKNKNIKRRTFQENLRKAEAKLFPHMIDNFLNKR